MELSIFIINCDGHANVTLRIRSIRIKARGGFQEIAKTNLWLSKIRRFILMLVIHYKLPLNMS